MARPIYTREEVAEVVTGDGQERRYGKPALGQNLLWTFLPFHEQRKQRELQQADTEIREEWSEHREDMPG